MFLFSLHCYLPAESAKAIASIILSIPVKIIPNIIPAGLNTENKEMSFIRRFLSVLALVNEIPFYYIYKIF